MTKTLTVHNAEIATATVEVQSLTISGKQVTLAVFRQLVDEDPLDEGDDWLGLPWGTVNYHPDKVCREVPAGQPRIKYVSCSGAPPHYHLVWQQGNELRRGTVWCPGLASGKRLRDRWPDLYGTTSDRWDEVEALPQLFIAI